MGRGEEAQHCLPASEEEEVEGEKEKTSFEGPLAAPVAITIACGECDRERPATWAVTSGG